MSDPGPWWREAVIYQIYPRSFVDGNGDGIGDLRGIVARLDYLAWLGVDAIWLTPIMPSPNADWGYDVSDYCAVHRDLGTLDDLDALLSAAHARDLRVLLDLVPNHTSDRHPWFADARRGPDAAHREWYVWADPAAGGGPPNNWLSLFGGPAWTLDRASGQYYLHSFLPSQPDLNWWNEAVRAAFDDILRFWLDRGVDGFRIDVAAGMIKDRGLRDNPRAETGDHAVVRALGQRQLFNMDRPEVHEVLRRWRTIADGYAQAPVLLGEAYVMDTERLAAYYGDGRDELHLAFNFLLLHADLDAGALRQVIADSEPLHRRGAWPAWAGSNHDAGRLASRWAHGDEDLARCVVMLRLLLRGTPVLYYGDELALQAAALPAHAVRDAGSDATRTGSRDGSRTPMPWHAGRGAGFTKPGTRPWLPVGDTTRANVAGQRDDHDSVLHLCRRLLALRRRHPELRSGELQLLDAPPGVLAWRRGQRFSVWLNLGDEVRTIEPGPGTVAEGTTRAAGAHRALPPRTGVVHDAGREPGRASLIAAGTGSAARRCTVLARCRSALSVRATWPVDSPSAGERRCCAPTSTPSARCGSRRRSAARRWSPMPSWPSVPTWSCSATSQRSCSRSPPRRRRTHARWCRSSPPRRSRTSRPPIPIGRCTASCPRRPSRSVRAR
jgi:alpha-glucosidase